MTMWNWTLLRAGGLRLDGGGMFGIIPKALWSRLVAPDDRNCIPLQTNCLLLERDGRHVLVETGCGDKWTPKERGIYGIEERCVLDALDEMGVAPEMIDRVIVTHLHFDHAGGLTRLLDGEPVPCFMSADVVVQQREWDDALANRSTMTGTYLRTHLDPIADRLMLVEGAQEIEPGIRVTPAPGHTWGQQAVLIDTVDGTLCFPGDLMPTVHHLGAPWSCGYDMEPWQTKQTKTWLFKTIADNNWLLVLDHEPGDAVHRLVPNERGWYDLQTP
ncbi:MAG: MBL fold metallo-hydrolase [Phycisphaerales bacterium]|nr:MBL fold metallo-hydrolase [Phycisphaerales bacterium]